MEGFSAASTRPGSAAVTPGSQQFYKTKMCPIYLREKQDEYQGLLAVNIGCTDGTCAMGGSCRFAHSLEDLRPLPDLSKTKLCSSYSGKGKERGRCALQPHCPFAHSPSELRTSSSVFYKVALCKFYKNDKCWNGSNCRFAHGSDELRFGAEASAPRKGLAFPKGQAFFNAAALDADGPPPARGPKERRPPLPQKFRGFPSGCSPPCSAQHSRLPSAGPAPPPIYPGLTRTGDFGNSQELDRFSSHQCQDRATFNGQRHAHIGPNHRVSSARCTDDPDDPTDLCRSPNTAQVLRRSQDLKSAQELKSARDLKSAEETLLEEASVLKCPSGSCAEEFSQPPIRFSFAAKHEPSIHPSLAATILEDSNSAAQAYVHFVLNSSI